jgi:hypothetical protein
MSIIALLIFPPRLLGPGRSTPPSQVSSSDYGFFFIRMQVQTSIPLGCGEFASGHHAADLKESCSNQEDGGLVTYNS